MSELKNSSYQESVSKKVIEPLNDFLGGVQRSKGFKKPFDPYFRTREIRTTSLSTSLRNIQEERGDDLFDGEGGDDDESGDDTEKTPEQVASSGDSSEGGIDVVDGLYLGPNQRYFMGASTEPPMVITTKVTPEKVHYFLFPYRREQILKKEIAADLFKTGSQTWMKDPKSRRDEDLRSSIKAVLSGEPGEKVSLDDYQYSNIQVRYTGSKEGDLEPWKDLESSFDVKVDSVLTNKQIYNLRLNNKDLEKFTSDIKSGEGDFKITKVIREEREYMIEAAKNPRLKVIEQAVAPSEKHAWGEIMNSNMSMNYAADNYQSGEAVSWKKQDWLIVDFVPSGEDMTVILLSPNFEKIAQFVPTKDLKKRDPLEMGPDDDQVPHESESKNKKKSEKPTGFCGKKVEGLPVDKTPKDKKLDFPKSGEDGVTQEQKALKQPKEMKEEDIPVISGKVKQLINSINNDPTLGAKDGRFKVIVENLLRKQKEGVYDSKLAEKAFEALADMGAKKCSKNPDAEFPKSVRQKTAAALRDQFENNVKLGNFKEDKSRETIVVEHIEKLISETQDMVNEAVEKEAVPFTEREKEVLNRFEGVDVSLNNVATFTWNSSGKNYKLEITKKPRPQTNDIVYAATTTFNNNQLDRQRTQDSDPFKTEDDPTILEAFLTNLQINEMIKEEKKKKQGGCPDLTGKADEKGLNVKDVNPEELAMGIRVEREHTKDIKVAKQIALDHIAENPRYYSKLLIPAEKAAGVKEEDADKIVQTDITAIEEDKKKSKSDEKRTKTKWVNALPIKDGRKVRTEITGDTKIVYRTFEEKRKKEEKQKKEKKTKKKGD